MWLHFADVRLSEVGSSRPIPEHTMPPELRVLLCSVKLPATPHPSCRSAGERKRALGNENKNDRVHQERRRRRGRRQEPKTYRRFDSSDGRGRRRRRKIYGSDFSPFPRPEYLSHSLARYHLFLPRTHTRLSAGYFVWLTHSHRTVRARGT